MRLRVIVYSGVVLAILSTGVILFYHDDDQSHDQANYSVAIGDQLKRDSSTSLPQQPPEENFPEDPSASVRKILESGLDRTARNNRLIVAAAHYSRQDPSVIQAFIENLPPGADSESALTKVIENIPKDHVPGMISWFLESGFDHRWNEIAISHLAGRWAQSDCFSAAKFFAENGDLEINSEIRGSWIASSLGYASEHQAEEVIRFVDSISNDSVKSHLKGSAVFIEAQIEQTGDPEAVISDTITNSDPRNLGYTLSSLSSVIRNLDQRGKMLDVVVGLDFEHRDAHVSRMILQWLVDDLNGGLAWVGELSDSSLRDKIIADNWRIIAQTDKSVANAWIEAITDPEIRSRVNDDAKNINF